MLTGAFDQASEIWWRRDCDEILAGSQPGDAVFAEIVRTLRPSLLPVAVPLKESLAQHCHLGLGQRIAVFIHDATLNHCSSLQKNGEIFHLLARAQREHATFGVTVMLVDFLIAGALDKQVIASGPDVFNTKAAIGCGKRSVVCAFILTLGDQLDEGFLDGLAARIPRHNSLHKRICRRRRLRG